MGESGLRFAEGIDPRFPKDKLKAAQCYLCAFNPWWYRYTSRITIQAFDGTKSTGDIAGTMRMVDLTLWIETHFALEATVEELAGQFRRALIASVRNIDLRLSHCQTRQERELRNVALQMEITSVADEEAEVLDKLSSHDIQVIVDRSYTFTRTAMQKYGVKEVPRDTSGVWRPEDFGWPRGLSAEDYYRKLKENDSTGDSSDSNDEDSDSEGDGSSEDSSDSESSQSDKSEDEQNQEDRESESDGSQNKESSEEKDSEEGGSSGDDQDEKENAESGGDSEESNEESSDSGEEGESGDADSSEGDSDSEESSNDKNDSDESPDGSESDSDSESDGDQESSDSEGDADSNSDSNEEQSSNQDQNPVEGDQESKPGGQQGASTSQEALKEQMKADPQKNWTARDFREPDPEDTDYTVGSEKDEALQELTEDMLNPESSSLAGWGISPGNSFVQYVYERQRKGPKDWKKRIGTPIVNSMKSAQVKGMSDMSYSRRNPHQPEFGPVMPGMVGSTPSMVIVLDVSGSMRGSLTEMFDSLNAIMRHMNGTYRTQCTWMTADTIIMNVGRGSTLNQKIIDDATSKGFGGTLTGPIIEELATKQVIFEGKKIKAPDVLTFITDGIGPKTLPWPDLARLPKTKSRIIIGRVLPSWLRLGGEAGLHRPDWATDKNWIDLSVLQEKMDAHSLTSLRR